MHKGKWGIALLLAVGLTACGQDVIEFRNAEIVNGKLYRSGEDTPFSGEATNVPLKKLMSIPSLAAFSKARDAYVTLGNEAFGGSDRKDFPHHDNLWASLCSGEFEDGEPDGDFECQSPKADHTTLKFSLGGSGNGEFVAYSRLDPDLVMISAPFKDHKLHGDFKIFGPDRKEPLYIGQYVMGKSHGKRIAHNANTGVLTETLEAVNGVQEGEYLRYFDDGSGVWQRRHYQGGRLHGRFEVYNRKGEIVLASEFENGNEVRKLPIGQQPQPEMAASAQEVASAEPIVAADDVDSCLQGWIDFHHRELGEDAAVSAQMLQEWEDGCKAGNNAP